MDPLTAYTVIQASLKVGDIFFSGKAHRKSLSAQRNFNELKGAKDFNDTWAAWVEEEKTNYAVFSSSNASPEWSGSFRAIQEEVGAKKKEDLDYIEIMTQSMTDEFNSRIAESRRSDMFNIAITAVGAKIQLESLALNEQHRKVTRAALEREKKRAVGFPINKKGHFTSRRDLFTDMNVGGKLTKLNIPKYKKEYHFGKTPLIQRQYSWSY